MIRLSWLHVRPAQRRPLVSQASSMSFVWLETASALRHPSVTQERLQWVMTSSHAVTPIWRGVTCVENSSGVFISKVYDAPVSMKMVVFCVFSKCQQTLWKPNRGVEHITDDVRPILSSRNTKSTAACWDCCAGCPFIDCNNIVF